MTVSASTPRLRLTLAWYVALIVLVAISARPCASGWLGGLADVAGFLLIAGAALGRIWTSLYIAGLKDAQLVTSGPYAACRNPLYFFSLVGGIGIGLVTGSLILTSATLVVLFVLYAQAMRAEERFLADRHGEEFRRYCASVPRLLPSWKRDGAAGKNRSERARVRQGVRRCGIVLPVVRAAGARRRAARRGCAADCSDAVVIGASRALRYLPMEAALACGSTALLCMGGDSGSFTSGMVYGSTDCCISCR